MKLPKMFRREAKQSATGAALVLTPGQPVWTGRDFKAYSVEAYGKNVVAFQAIDRIGEALASVKLGLFKGEKELETHDVLTLLARPNPGQSFAQYIKAKAGFYLLAGNGYEERVVLGKKVKELYQLRPDRTKIIPAAGGGIYAYQYEANGRKVMFDVDPVTMESDVRHLKTFNPLSDWYGMSPLEAGAYAVDQNNEANAWLQALLQNSARPSGALVSKDADHALSDEQFARLKAQIEDQYQGSRNAGRPMLLEGGLDWKQMGLSPVDMSILEIKYSSARDVCLAYGVPPQLLGIPGDNTYSNYQEARLAFWEDTVLPLLNMFVGDWNEWLCGPLGVELRPDLDKIPAIAEKRFHLWEMVEKSTSLTLNEKRQAMGYEDVPYGDAIYGSALLTPLGAPKAVPDMQDAVAKAIAYGLEAK